MINRLIHIVTMLLFSVFQISAQNATLEGEVFCGNNTTAPFSTRADNIVTVVVNGGEYRAYTDQNGFYQIDDLPLGKVHLTFFCLGYEAYNDSIFLNPGKNNYSIELKEKDEQLETIVINGEEDNSFSVKRLRSIEGTSIYAGKKNEVIEMAEVNGNTANNNSREIYAKIPGLNIWESDDAGIQLGIGARGLSPKRTESFNVRQNGYDISADALGYPESYYTPASDALEAIQIVRGAASLQYGSQFGGLLNFVMKKPAAEKIRFTTKNTYASYNRLTSYNSVSGTSGRLSYFAYYQYKKGNGWRPNSQYEQHQGFANINYMLTEKMKISFDYTSMYYKAQQPGGLTDYMFNEDPTQSIRSRNWFKVKWNLAALRWNWDINPQTSWSIRAFGLRANRQALGFLGRIDRVDPMEERDLIRGEFMNSGVESRFLKRYQLGAKTAGAWLIGGRYYTGETLNQQGLANANSDDNFNFLQEENAPLHSDFTFPSQNVALFSENVFFLSKNWTVVPGARFEYINTRSAGTYLHQVKHPLTNEILVSEQLEDQNQSERSFFLLGVGSNYKLKGDSLEMYVNFSQNYRAINFNDIRINNPNFRVDPQIQDESGYNADIGFRGQIGKVFTYDLSFFYLKYNDRIGEILQTDTTNWVLYRYRTNVSDAQNFGVEAYAEIDWFRLGGDKLKEMSLKTFVNFSWIDARYINSDNSAVSGNRVEMVAPLTFRAGLNYQWKQFNFGYQLSFVQEHFTDATNATSTTDAIYGTIPSYLVMDLSTSYEFKKWFTLSGGVNNLTNSYYFTRRATGYPGPGIIPSMPISAYVSLQFDIASGK